LIPKVEGHNEVKFIGITKSIPTRRILFMTIGSPSGLCHYDRHGNDCCCN